MGFSNLYDCVTDAKSMLIDNWTLTPSPVISFVWDEKTTGFMDDRQDFILMAPTAEDVGYFGLYGTDFLHTIYITIDIHTFENIDHHSNIVNEVVKIIKANIRRTDFIDLMLVSTSQENDLYRNIYRHTISIKYRKLNP